MTSQRTHPETGEVASDKNSVVCPLCGDIMWHKERHRKGSSTHTWACEACPGELFEYCTDDDVKSYLPKRFTVYCMTPYAVWTDISADTAEVAISYVKTKYGTPRELSADEVTSWLAQEQ